MSEIVREIPGARKHKHRLKRFWRFLSNPRWKPEKLWPYYVAWCLKTFVHERIVAVAIDWTTLPGNIQCLMIALPFHGRAIPLLWHLVRFADIADSQNRIEERLLARLTNLVQEITPDKKLLVTADRGFGRATLIQFLQKKQELFVVRVRGEVIIRTAEGKRIILKALGKTLKENEPVWYEQITYREDGVVGNLNFTAVVAPPKEKGADPDPWFLLTNLRKKETTILRYASRFQIEEWFRDLKHELGIHQLQTKNLMRARRMVCIAVMAYGLTLLVGTVAKRLKTIQDRLITGGKKTASRIWFALKIIKQKLCGPVFWRKVYQQATVP